MTARYRVRDWGVHFENTRSRDYKKLDWVPIPNKHDGKGYRRLIALENGPALFAAWVDGQTLYQEFRDGIDSETRERDAIRRYRIDFKPSAEKALDKVRSGIISKSEDAMTVHQDSLLTELLAEYIATMQATGRAPAYVTETERMIQRLIDELSLRRLRDIRAEAVEHWLAQKTGSSPESVGEPASHLPSRLG